MMNDMVEIWEKPTIDEIYMIAGWRQWADAGSVSSALPQYLVERLGAREIGRVKTQGFYLFQLPGMHHLLRPEIKLQDGHRQELSSPKNQIFFWQNERKGLVLFLGDEPHLNIEGYAEAFFSIAQELGVRRVVTLGGVYAPVPYDKDRDISCTYSLHRMKPELEKYAVGFSDYEGGVSIGSYLLDRAEALDLEYLVLYAMVPFYDLSSLDPALQGIGIEEDYKAWYDLMGRLSHMFDLGLDLSELRRQGQDLIESMDAKIAELEETMPELHIRGHLDELYEGFTERTFAPLSDVWESGLSDLFRDEDES